MSPGRNKDFPLAGPCGFYCGLCKHYLARARGKLEEQKLKDGCRGCRIQEKTCSWIKKDCALIRKKEIDFCFQCARFPCVNLKKLNQRHMKDDGINLLANLKDIQKMGVKPWLKVQRKQWACPACGGSICIDTRKCFDCGC